MRGRVTRRRFVAGLGGAVLVAGFDPLAGRWLAAAEAAECPSFAGVPPLDGTLSFDGASLAGASTDLGNIVHSKPCAVLRPASTSDVQKMVRYCLGHGIPVAPRGEAHSTHGHTLAGGGLVIEMGSMDVIHSIDEGGAVVDAGVLWRSILEAGDAQKLTPKGITGYTKLSVGGTLSVGGVGAQTSNEGMQIQSVRELEVVTGTGDVVTCSMNHRRDLFESVLGGLGQFGVITRATIELVPAPDRARVFTPHYTDNAAFFSDLRTLLGRGELDSVYNVWFPFGTNFLYELTAVAFYDDGGPQPDGAHLMRGLSVPSALIGSRDSTYLEYLFLIDDLFDAYFEATGYQHLVKPWFDVWLPEATVEDYVAEIVPSLTPRDVGPTGFVLLFPQRRGAITRPFYRVPDVPDGEYVYLFDVLTSSLLPGRDDGFAAEMVARNRRWYDAAVEAGGTRYVIGSLDFGPADWAAHYGPVWQEFKARKHQFDPAGILSPGLGIF